MLLDKLLIAISFSFGLYLVLSSIIDKEKEFKKFYIKMLVFTIYTISCFMYANNRFITMEQSYKYITNNIDEYNLFLFKCANIKYDDDGQRLKFGIDQYLIDRLNETDWYEQKKELKIIDINE